MKKVKKNLDIKFKPIIFCFIFWLHRKVTYQWFRNKRMSSKLINIHNIVVKNVKKKKDWNALQKHFIIMCSSILVHFLKMDNAYRTLFYSIIKDLKNDKN